MYILIGTVVLVLAWIVFFYNKQINLTNMKKEAWSGIETQLKRRYDLIPNLVKTAKQFCDYEKDTFEEITRIRSAAMAMGEADLKSVGDKNSEISGYINKIVVLQEDYPDLKANKSFLEIMQSISEVEDGLQYARRYYNGTVRNYNIFIEKFPNIIMANFMKLQKSEYFEVETAKERENVSVEL